METGNRGNIIAKIRQRKRKTKALFIFLLTFLMGLFVGSAIGAQQARNTIHFDVVYSSEKESWMEEIKPLFEAWYEERFPDVDLKVNFFTSGSRESIIAILNGQYQPAIWSPAASIWIPYINYLWSQGGNTVPLTSIHEEFIYNPIVIAMWDSVRRLNNVSSIEDVYELTKLDPSPIKLGHTDPRLSNSGFCTIVMEVAAAARKPTKDLTYDDLLNESVQAWIKQFESTAVQYGKSTGYLMRAMLQSGPSQITTAFLYENLVIESSYEAEKRWNDKVLAIYPEEGSIHSDHPMCILDGAPWMRPEILNVSKQFLEFLGQVDILERATRLGFRVYNENVTLPDDVFNIDNGVVKDIPNAKMSIPGDPYFISRVSDLWLKSRPVI